MSDAHTPSEVSASGRDRLRVALLQLAVQDGRPDRNLERALDLLGGLTAVDLVLLPELWTSGYAYEAWEETADDHTPGVVRRLRGLACEKSAWIGGSLLSRRSDGGLANRFWLVPPDGGPPVWYDKRHLFEPMGEPERLVAGDRRVRTEIAAPWTAGLSLCYDLRFPEMYRQDALQGACLFLVPSEWPEERRNVLSLLARARAAENQAYLAVCNRAGQGRDGTAFGGGSMLVAPGGEVVCRAGADEEVVVDVAEFEKVLATRRAIPLLTPSARSEAGHSHSEDDAP